MRINIGRTMRDVQRAIGKLNQLERRILDEALPRSLNRTADHARTRAVRALAAEMGVVQRDIREAIKVSRATKARPVAVITARGAAIPLRRFRPTQTKAGVTASAWGRRRLYRGTFLAPLSGGGVGVFKRGRGGRRGEVRTVRGGPNAGARYRSELPIRQLWGPSVPRTFAERRVRDQVIAAVRDFFPRELARNIRYWSDRLGR